MKVLKPCSRQFPAWATEGRECLWYSKPVFYGMLLRLGGNYSEAKGRFLPAIYFTIAPQHD